MIIFVGASASGKTELAKLLFNTYGYLKIITTTTRPMRTNERQGIDYHFLSKEEFLEMQERNAFVEVTHYQGNLYGMQKRDVVINGLVIMDPAGANTLINNSDQELFVVYVESMKELRKSRMMNRGDHPNLVEGRLLTDDIVFRPEVLKKIDLYIKNEDQPLQELAELIHLRYQSYIKSKN